MTTDTQSEAEQLDEEIAMLSGKILLEDKDIAVMERVLGRLREIRAAQRLERKEQK